MKKRAVKVIISIIMITALFCNFIGISGHAVSGTATADLMDWLNLMLWATGITVETTLGSVDQAIDYITYGAPQNPITYTYGGTEWEDAVLDRSIIQVLPNNVLIDGQPYTQIWLGNNASQALRTNIFDLQTWWNIFTNNDRVTFASGAGNFEGIPIFLVSGNQYKAQTYIVDIGSYAIGNTTFTSSSEFNGSNKYRAIGTWSLNAQSPMQDSWGYNEILTCPGTLEITLNGHTQGTVQAGLRWKFNINGGSLSQKTMTANGYFDAQQFSYDWVSETIEPQQLNPDDGLLINLPSNNPNTQQIVNYYINNYGTPAGGHELDLDIQTDQDFVDLLDTILDTLIALGVLTDLLVDLAPQPTVEPTPPPEPSPGTSIGNTPWENLEYKLEQIKSAIQSIPEKIELATQTLVQKIEDFRDKVIKAIEEHPLDIIDKGLDAIKNLIAPILLQLKNFIGIWHYVVEWIQSISNCMTWIFNIVNGTSYYLVLPFYALIAGTLVIAIYRKFGR